MIIEPYLFFEGRCEEAIEFYKKTLGAEVKALMRYKDNPDKSDWPPNMNDKVMHGLLRIGEANVMVSDGMCSGNATFGGFSLSIAVETESEADRIFAALSDGGHVTMPLNKTFFSPKFGMVSDKFGVPWMVIVFTEQT